ncbi:MAG: capsule biosynthesis protein, partial [Sphingobacteriales bacterium]
MVGPVNVGGLTVDRARDRIRAAMLPYYPSLRSGNTQLNITLGNIRSISVTLNGQVVKSGTFTLPSLATVFNALHASGGPNDNGSFRKIQLIRNGEVVSTIDVYKFLLSGVQQGNIQLRDRDVINIPFYTTRVEVTGEAKVPGLYELLPGEKFNDVLNFAGGFSQMAYTSKVKVFQNTDKERKILDIMEKDFGTYQPKNGDKFFLEPILERFENRVEIAGAVFRPAFYSLEPGLTISGLIGKAEGIKEDAFLSRAYIQRLAADNTATLIPFDLAKVLNGSATDIELQREDKVIISSIFDLREEYNVTIGGEVRLPATYRFAENMSLEDLIQMAGGFKEGATPGRVAIARRVRNSDGQSKEATTAEVFEVAVDKNLKLSGTPFLLQPFDIVTVRGAEGYEIQKQVFIEGEVRSPGPYTIISKNERISDLIKRAGGFTAFAYLDGASLKRPSLNKADVQGNAVDSEEQK